MINYIVRQEINNSQFALHFNESGSDCLALAARLCQVSINTNRVLLTPQPPHSQQVRSDDWLKSTCHWSSGKTMTSPVCLLYSSQHKGNLSCVLTQKHHSLLSTYICLVLHLLKHTHRQVILLCKAPNRATTDPHLFK